MLWFWWKNFGMFLFIKHGQLSTTIIHPIGIVGKIKIFLKIIKTIENENFTEKLIND
jgi:hypothetical protein